MAEGVNQKRILLVEDDGLIAMLSIQNLHRYGYDVLHVFSGEKAIELVNSKFRELDLILMDIDLNSEMDGTEAAIEILSKHDIPILFLSSHTEREIVEKTEGITSYGYVVKNSNITVLDASIKMAFRLFEMKQKTKVIEENLRTHQIELQIQNDQYKSTEIELSILNTKYFNIYHLAPVGYITINENGLIQETNLTARNILGVLHSRIIQQSILNFVLEKDQEIFLKFQKSLFGKEFSSQNDRDLMSSSPESCRLGMHRSNGEIYNAYIVANVIENFSTTVSSSENNSKYCYIILVEMNLE